MSLEQYQRRRQEPSGAEECRGGLGGQEAVQQASSGLTASAEGRVAAIVARALEDGLSPREIVIEHELPAAEVVRHIEALCSLDDCVTAAVLAERVEQLEGLVAHLYQLRVPAIERALQLALCR